MTEKIIEIRYPEGLITLVLPNAFDKLSLPSLKKIFKILLEKDWFEGNEDTIREIDEFIPEWIDDWRNQWNDTSRIFCTDYKDPDYNGKTTKEQNRIKRNNSKLLKDVTTAKKRHERALKVQDAWAKLKEKYYIR